MLRSLCRIHDSKQFIQVDTMNITKYRDLKKILKCTGPVSYTKEYMIWSEMKQRCENPLCPLYSRYGGSGIKIDERWRKFENFVYDMGKRPKNRTLERINNRGNYSPENCRWATQMDQTTNTRRTYWININGELKSVQQWSKELNIHRKYLNIIANAGGKSAVHNI